MEVPEARPSPRSQAPARTAGQREDAPCCRARWEETANESRAAGGGLGEGRLQRACAQPWASSARTPGASEPDGELGRSGDGDEEGHNAPLRTRVKAGSASDTWFT